MATHTEIEALYRRLKQERRKIVEACAETGLVPPSSLLAHLADIDRALVAIETILDEQPPYDQGGNGPELEGLPPTKH